MTGFEDRPENRYGPGSGAVPAVSTAEVRELLTVAVDVAQAAAAHVRARRPQVFGGPGRGYPAGGVEAVRAKSTPTDPVTVVDTEAEDLVRSMLARLRPDDAVLGEEAGGGAARPGTVRWVVDPIDGTVNFLYGIPAYAVSLAAQVDGRSVAGAVVDVAGRRLYTATAGGGAHVTDDDGTVAPLQVTGVSDPAVALVATGFGYERSRRVRQGRVIAELLPQVRDIRRIGAGALDLCMVAAGQVDAHFEHGLSPWDWAAGALIAGEAGAVVHVPGPDSTSGEGAVTLAAAPGVAAALRRILEQAGGLDPIPAD
ncbi:inositol monophosphatase family protein [Tomitella cavernea]|uniref:Inositol-1-monophosphatase n=1 Tax=Tomitella cavernea TaxID=1387982 RepID=A0ABP9CPA9_9ACTN